MSKVSKDEISKEDNGLTPQSRISPTSINTFKKCPRGYFYNYIVKLRVTPNIHMVKGSVVHKALEDFYRGYPKTGTLKTHMNLCLESALKQNEKLITNLRLPDEEVASAKKDCTTMATEYLIMLERRIKSLIERGKAENVRHAYYLLKPKMRELYVKNEDLHCCGFIDRIHEDFNGVLTIADYKTSSKYGVGLPEDYKRQLSIYSLLYKLQEGRQPDFSGVIFLRYGESYFLEVTPSLLRYARDTINDVWAKTRSSVIEDYPLKESNLCRWCQFQNICNGQEDWEATLRKQKLMDKLKEVKEEVTTK